MNYNDAELAALRSDVRNIGVFFRLDTAVPVLIWLGVFDIEPGVNVFDATGARYSGFGELRNIPAFKQLLNGSAERVEFTLSGVSGEVLQKALADAAQVKGKRVATGFALLDERYALLGPVHWMARYIADFLAREQRQTDDPKTPIVRTIALSCGTRYTGRRRPAYSYWSKQDQQARFPGDEFCSIAANYAHGFTKQFPVF